MTNNALPNGILHQQIMNRASQPPWKSTWTSWYELTSIASGRQKTAMTRYNPLHSSILRNLQKFCSTCPGSLGIAGRKYNYLANLVVSLQAYGGKGGGKDAGFLPILF